MCSHPVERKRISYLLSWSKSQRKGETLKSVQSAGIHRWIPVSLDVSSILGEVRKKERRHVVENHLLDEWPIVFDGDWCREANQLVVKEVIFSRIRWITPLFEMNTFSFDSIGLFLDYRLLINNFLVNHGWMGQRRSTMDCRRTSWW